jgi:hypothetical protein
MLVYWNSDPVHMTTARYEALARAVSAVASNITFTRPARPARTPCGRVANLRPARRASWVSQDEVTAERASTSSGGWRPPRGQYQGQYRSQGQPGKGVWDISGEVVFTAEISTLREDTIPPTEKSHQLEELYIIYRSNVIL